MGPTCDVNKRQTVDVKDVYNLALIDSLQVSSQQTERAENVFNLDIW